MTGFTRHDLPCDITVHGGNFSGQPAAFAYLLGACDALDLTHVEVIRDRPAARLRARFDAQTTEEIAIAAAECNTIILILPAAYDGLDCPLADTDAAPLLGVWRGSVPHMVADRPAP
jgi:hypothetical protein